MTKRVFFPSRLQAGYFALGITLSRFALIAYQGIGYDLQVNRRGRGAMPVSTASKGMRYP